MATQLINHYQPCLTITSYWSLEMNTPDDDNPVDNYLKIGHSAFYFSKNWPNIDPSRSVVNFGAKTRGFPTSLHQTCYDNDIIISYDITH